MTEGARRSESTKPARGDWEEQERQELEENFRAVSERKTTPRDRAGGALQVAIRHFDALGVSRDLFYPLLEIQTALDEGERGLLHPLFRPDAKPGRPRRPWAQVQQQRYAALAMELLIRAGERREQAAKTVARVLKKIGYRFPPKSEAEWRTVAEIRDEMRRSLAGKARKSEFYDDYEVDQLWIDQAIEDERKDPADLAKQVLSWLSAMRF
jgi:hypothetical protein